MNEALRYLEIHHPQIAQITQTDSEGLTRRAGRLTYHQRKLVDGSDPFYIENINAIRRAANQVAFYYSSSFAARSEMGWGWVVERI